MKNVFTWFYWYSIKFISEYTRKSEKSCLISVEEVVIQFSISEDENISKITSIVSNRPSMEIALRWTHALATPTVSSNRLLWAQSIDVSQIILMLFGWSEIFWTFEMLATSKCGRCTRVCNVKPQNECQSP